MKLCDVVDNRRCVGRMNDGTSGNDALRFEGPVWNLRTRHRQILIQNGLPLHPTTGRVRCTGGTQGDLRQGDRGDRLGRRPIAPTLDYHRGQSLVVYTLIVRLYSELSARLLAETPEGRCRKGGRPSASVRDHSKRVLTKTA